jgi:predicted enzyme related to lactoylglutathione lyase
LCGDRAAGGEDQAEPGQHSDCRAAQPIVEESPFALVADAGGTMQRLTAVERTVAAPYTVLGWDVADIASMMDQLSARGVQFTRYQGIGQDDRGVWTAPGGAKIAWFLDPDGNNLSLTQFETSE